MGKLDAVQTVAALIVALFLFFITAADIINTL